MGIFPASVKFPPNLSFAGQDVLITGGSSGLGLETAVHYVNLGASSVIITARNAARGKEAVAAIEARTGKTGLVTVRTLDMDSFSDVKRFSDDLGRDIKAIDIVLLNAGCFNVDYEQSLDGWEADIQVNVLSTTLLALLLLPWMRSVQQPGRNQHLGIVGSSTHTSVDINAKDFPKNDVLDYWNEEKHYQWGAPSYARSKLFVQYAALEIAKLVLDTERSPSPIVNTVCPGPVGTGLARQFASRSFIHKCIVALWNFRCLNPDVGARALVLAATTSPTEHGKFIRHYMTDTEYDIQAKKNITSEAGQKMQAVVWEEILRILEVAVPEVKSIARPKS